VESPIKSLLSPRMSVLTLRDECAQSKEKIHLRKERKKKKSSSQSVHVLLTLHDGEGF